MGKWNEPYNYEQVIQVQSVKRRFNLDRRFEPGMGDLLVYYNGVLMTVGDMYKEVNPYAIDLTFDPEIGDQIICRYQRLW